MVLILALFGCATKEEIKHEREVTISNMDNLDVCYNLGKQGDFEYWKLIKNEQFKRQTQTMQWNVSDELCNQAISMGRDALAQKELNRKKRNQDIVDSINDATNSISNGYKNASKVSVKRTNCQTYGTSTNCVSY